MSSSTFGQLSILAFLVVLLTTDAFRLAANHGRRAGHQIKMHFEEAGTGLAEGLLTRDRYIATNRFNVRPNKEAIFEARWANRKSRLALLDGFRFFTLLKKIRVEGASSEEDSSLPNYVSYTIWEEKENFDAWRSGEAFKEAHGGGGIMDFIQLISTALFIIKGKPTPAFFDAILPVTSSMTNKDLGISPNEKGWRDFNADGETLLPTDVLVSQDRFSVKDESKAAFEKTWQERELALKDVPGFFGFFLQRRDALKADDNSNYIASIFWRSLADYENFKLSHSVDASMLTTSSKRVLYEGKLALLSSKGP